jgi:hypothetical protein
MKQTEARASQAVPPLLVRINISLLVRINISLLVRINIFDK